MRLVLGKGEEQGSRAHEEKTGPFFEVVRGCWLQASPRCLGGGRDRTLWGWVHTIGRGKTVQEVQMLGD